MAFECPGCGKGGAYIESNGYEIIWSDSYRGEAQYRCEDCGIEFYWDGGMSGEVVT